MNTFNKDDFNYHGGYLMYSGDCGKFNEYFQEPCHPTRLGMRKEAFVARFKYGGGKPQFMNFLIKNFTVEEYFTLTDRNGQNMTPIGALETKGYISPNVRKAIKGKNEAAGYAKYPLTPAGFKQAIADEVAERQAA